MHHATWIWDLGRAAGIVSFLLFSLAIIWGTGTVRKLKAFRPGGPAQSFHIYLALMGSGFLAAHIALMMADHYAHLSAGKLLGLQTGSGVILGVLATWLIIVSLVSSLLWKKNFLAKKTWKMVHLSAYAIWPLFVVHSVVTGTNRSSPPLIIFYLLVTGATVYCVAARSLLPAGARLPQPRRN